MYHPPRLPSHSRPCRLVRRLGVHIKAPPGHELSMKTGVRGCASSNGAGDFHRGEFALPEMSVERPTAEAPKMLNPVRRAAGETGLEGEASPGTNQRAVEDRTPVRMSMRNSTSSQHRQPGFQFLQERNVIMNIKVTCPHCG